MGRHKDIQIPALVDPAKPSPSYQAGKKRSPESNTLLAPSNPFQDQPSHRAEQREEKVGHDIMSPKPPHHAREKSVPCGQAKHVIREPSTGVEMEVEDASPHEQGEAQEEGEGPFPFGCQYVHVQGEDEQRARLFREEGPGEQERGRYLAS